MIAGDLCQWETPESELRHLLDVDVVDMWNAAAATVPAMLAAPPPRDGRFVAVSSAAGVHGLFSLSAHTVAKHAVVGLVRALAADRFGTRVTSVTVAPTSTRTDMLDATARLYGLAEAESFAGSSLHRRVQEVHEVAEVITFCRSPEAGPSNAPSVHADGGFRP